MALPKFPTINQELLSQLRGLFFPKDAPIMLPNNGFIGLHSIDTPDLLPPFPYRFIYIKADGCAYILDYEGKEYKVFSSDVSGNLFVDGNINITGEYQINGYNTQSVLALFLSLPGLIGLWYGGRFQRSTGNMPNLIPAYGGTNRQDLALNGNPTFNYLANGVGYADLDGTGDYFSVADNTDLDIQGNESYVSNPGLTLGCWFRWDTGVGNNRALIGKASGGGTVSYYLSLNTSNYFVLVYSTDGNLGGGSSESISSSPITPLNTGWYFGVGRWTPSTERSVFLNGTFYQTASSAFATIYNSNSPLEIGRIFGGNLLDGKISVAFLCASSLSDAIIQSTYQQTKSLYGL